MDDTLVRFCSKLGVRPFTSEQINNILGSRNPIVKIIKTNYFHSAYSHIIDIVRNVLSQIKFANLNNPEIEKKLSCGCAYVSESTQIVMTGFTDQEKEFIKIMLPNIVKNFVSPIIKSPSGRMIVVNTILSEDSDEFIVDHKISNIPNYIKNALAHNINLPEIVHMKKNIERFKKLLVSDAETVKMNVNASNIKNPVVIEKYTLSPLEELNKLFVAECATARDEFLKTAEEYKSALASVQAELYIEGNELVYKRTIVESFELVFGDDTK